MSIEEMKQVLEVLTDQGQLDPNEYKEKKNESITSLRQAIEHAENQEPVAILQRYPSKGLLTVDYTDEITEVQEGTWPLYTTPQQRKPLTDELLEVLKQILDYHTTSKPWNAKDGDMSVWIKSARSVIAKATGEKA